jgi:hypothetical protein
MPPRTSLERLAALLLLITLLLPGAAARAQTGDASQIIDAVNALRARYGKPAYVVDGSLMSFSQSHSDYQAAIGFATHTHKDGTNPNNGSVYENVAVTDGWNLEFVMNTVWSDEIHMTTMVGLPSGSIGAGVATASDGEVYYTIDVRKGAGAINLPSTNTGGDTGSVNTTPFATLPPIEPLVTSTPRPNGYLVHTVGYGQTLWDIALAYGVHIEDLRGLNSMPEGSNSIYTGQKLLVHVPLPSTATAAVLTMTAAPEATHAAANVVAQPASAEQPSSTPTVTHTLPQPTETPAPTFTASPSPTATPTVSSFKMPDTRTLGIGLIAVCAIGLVVVFASGLRKG